MRKRLGKRDVIESLIIYLILDAIVSYLFYDSTASFGIFILFFPVFIAKRKREILSRQNEMLRYQFCEMIDVISTSLSAGISVENSFRESRNAMEKMFGDSSIIVHELDEIIKKLDINISLNSCLKDFSKRADIDDIKDFTTVFSETIKNGGNQTEIIKNTVSIIQEKKRMEDEIQAMLKGKMLEQKVVSVIPVLILAYLKISSGEYMDILYHNAAGVVVMTICVAIYISSYIISEKVICIKV